MLSFNRKLSTRFFPVVNKSIFSIGATTKTLQIRYLSALSPEGSGNGSSVKSEASADKARGDEAKYRISSVGGGNGSSVKSMLTRHCDEDQNEPLCHRAVVISGESGSGKSIFAFFKHAFRYFKQILLRASGELSTLIS